MPFSAQMEYPEYFMNAGQIRYPMGFNSYYPYVHPNTGSIGAGFNIQETNQPPFFQAPFANPSPIIYLPLMINPSPMVNQLPGFNPPTKTNSPPIVNPSLMVNHSKEPNLSPEITLLPIINSSSIKNPAPVVNKSLKVKESIIVPTLQEVRI